MIKIGVKTDPINTRYSFDWLFDLLNEEKIDTVQLGSFFELYSLDDDYFLRLKEKAAKKNIRVKSVFTAHRELGGFFYGDVAMEKVARKNYERLIDIAGVLGADYCGSNPGSVHRDQMHLKQAGLACYTSHMRDLMKYAHEKGLKGLTLEPMSCLAEPPTLPQEIEGLIDIFMEFQSGNPGTVPVYICGDTSHGYANKHCEVIYSSKGLFNRCVPYMAEFHFKNTDWLYNQTFGFSESEQLKGHIRLEEFREICVARAEEFPVREVVGYLEIPGPKVGRDYSDGQLGGMLRDSIRAVKGVFDSVVSGDSTTQLQTLGKTI